MAANSLDRSQILFPGEKHSQRVAQPHFLRELRTPDETSILPACSAQRVGFAETGISQGSAEHHLKTQQFPSRQKTVTHLRRG